MVHPHGPFEYEHGGGWKNSRFWIAVGGSLAAIGAGVLAGLTLANSSAEEEPTVETKTVTFDDLGVGSNVIMVYPGVASTEADKQPNGTYFDGQTATADCRIDGRTVPQPGEGVALSVEERSTWVHLRRAGVTSFAVTAYLEGGLKSADGLGPCK